MSRKLIRPSSVCYTKEQFSAYNAMKRAERAAKKARAARLARRDAEYAASGVEVTVEVRGNRVIETRGRARIASRCCGYHQWKNGGCYAVYR